MRLGNGYQIRVDVFVVYDVGQLADQDEAAMTDDADALPKYQWTPVSRGGCVWVPCSGSQTDRVLL